MCSDCRYHGEVRHCNVQKERFKVKDGGMGRLGVLKQSTCRQ